MKTLQLLAMGTVLITGSQVALAEDYTYLFDPASMQVTKFSLGEENFGTNLLGLEDLAGFRVIHIQNQIYR